jgi:hypothetical protein
MNPETKTEECRECEKTFECIHTGGYYYPPRYCEKCAAIKIRENYQEAVTKMESRITEATPARYRATGTGHPEFNVKLWQHVKEWQPTAERPWLGLSGAPGKCKTRCAFLKLREMLVGLIQPPSHPDKGVWTPSFKAISAARFQETVMGQFSDETKSEAVDSLDSLKTIGVLLFDDLGKQRNTPAVTQELFALLDSRHAYNLTTIWTSNGTPEGICDGMPENFAAPLSGRINECSTIFTV